MTHLINLQESSLVPHEVMVSHAVRPPLKDAWQAGNFIVVFQGVYVVVVVVHPPGGREEVTCDDL